MNDHSGHFDIQEYMARGVERVVLNVSSRMQLKRL